MDGFLLRVLAALQVGPPPRPRVRRWRPALRGLPCAACLATVAVRLAAACPIPATCLARGQHPPPACLPVLCRHAAPPQPHGRRPGRRPGGHCRARARSAVRAGGAVGPCRIQLRVALILNPKPQPVAQARPDVTEVEVSPSGDWRVPGEAAWRSILAPAPAAAAAGAGAAARVKAEAPCERAAGAAAAGALGADGGGGGARARTPCPTFPVAFAATCGSAERSQDMWYATRVLPASLGSDSACLRSRVTGPWYARGRLEQHADPLQQLPNELELRAAGAAPTIEWISLTLALTEN